MAGPWKHNKHSALCRRLWTRAGSLVLAFILIFNLSVVTASAVTGSTVAADGTYSGSSSEGTVYVSVSGGKITSVTASVKEKYQGYITDAFKSVVGKPATYDAIDSVSTATKHMNYIKSGALKAIQSASAADGSGSGSGSGSGTEEPEEESEIGQGIGSKTGTKYTGRAYVNGDPTDEWVELDVYVSGGKITGVFIAAEDGSWLNLLTSLQNSFIGTKATTATVDAITSATSLGFRDTIRNAISNAVGKIQSGNSSSNSYTACASGTVSWQMIRDNQGTYYWIDDDGEYCLLTAVKTSNKYYVTLYRSSKSNGTELRYLRQDKDDDSGSKHEWDSASAKYTGGKLYTKGGSTGESFYTVTFNYNGHGTTTTQTVAAGGKATRPADPTASGYKFVNWYTSAGNVYDFSSTVNSSFTLYARWDLDDSGSGSDGGDGGSSVYTGSGRVSFSKDDYTFDVFVYVENGKITNITSTLTSTPQKSDSRKEYHPEAVAAILKKLKGKDATSATVDAISSGTPKYSYAALKAAIVEALGGVVQEQKAVINVDTADMSLTEGGTSTRAATKEGCTISVSSSDPAVATVKYNDNSNTITVTGVKAGTATITVTGTATDGYTAPAKKTFTVTVSDGSSGTAIINPSGVSDNDLSLTKVLSSSGSGDNTSYTITLTGKAIKAASATYTVDGYGKEYSYDSLNTGKYYYLYKNNYYKVLGLKYYSSDKEKDYYCGYITINGTRYYLEKEGPIAYSSDQLNKEHPGDDDSKKAYKSCKEKDIENGEKLPLYIMKGTASEIGSSAYLRDMINTTLFDLRNASITSNINVINVVKLTLSKSTGEVAATGYDYSGNYGGTPLIVTISGLKLKSGISAGTYNSNSSNATIYKSSSTTSSNLLVSIGSPKLTVAAAAEQKDYTLTYDANGGASAPAVQTGKSADDSYTFVVTDGEPAYTGHTFLGWAESSTATTPGFIAGESITVQKDASGSTGSKTLYAVWEENTTAGKYVDGTTVVERYGYNSTVSVTVDENGNIKEITATPGGAEGYSLQLFNDALAALQEELEGKPASAATVNAFPETNASADAVTGATLSTNALKIAINKALQAKNLIQWKDAEEKGGTVLDAAYYTDGTIPSYMGEGLGTSFKEWTPEITSVSGSKDYTAVYYEADDYTLTVEDMVMDLRANPLSAGLRNGNWVITPEDANGQMYPYPVMELKAGSMTLISHEKGYKTDSENGYQYSYTSDNEGVAKQFIVYGTGMPELEMSGAPGKANMELTIRDKDGNELGKKTFTVTVNPCTITWNVDGTPVTTLANVDGAPKSGLNPAKEGMSFLGWSTDPGATEGTPESKLPVAAGNTTYYAVFGQSEEALPDGVYGDFSQKINNGRFINYTPIVSILVEDGKIKDLVVDADTATEANWEYLNNAINGIRDYLVNKAAVPSTIEDINISSIDSVSGATVSANAIKASLQKAVSEEAKGPFTVTWDADNNDSGSNVTKTDIRYGTRTASSDAGMPEQNPTKEADAQNSYEFQLWTPDPTDTANLFVTADATYKASYEETPVAATGHKIIITDYTKGGATTTLEADATYTSGREVTFNVTAPVATVLAIHEGATEETKDSQDGTFTRLYCTATEVENQYQFSVTMGDEDVYLVMGYKGDANLDGTVGMTDANLIDRIFVKTYKNATPLKKLIGDANGDGSIGISDSNMIDRSFVKLFTLKWDVSK